jgi:hypothetical protein
MFATGAPAFVMIAVLAQSGWTVQGGRETFTFRDVARAGPPADASPIEWTGSGPSLTVLYERANAKRAHRALVDVASAGSFDYAGPVRRAAASSDDHARRLEGRYEYRRYLLGRRLPRGLDVVGGVQGMLRRLSLDRSGIGGRHEAVSTSGALAGVVGVRVRRWTRWWAEIDWTNGLAVLRERNHYDVDPLADVDLWGGAWLTDLSVTGGVRIAPRVSLSASWLQTGEGNAVSHHNYVFGRQRLVVGVTYAR